MKYTKPSIVTKKRGTKPLTANFAPPPPEEPEGPDNDRKSISKAARKPDSQSRDEE